METKAVLELNALELATLAGCLAWMREQTGDQATKGHIETLCERVVEGLRALENDKNGNTENPNPTTEVNDGTEG